ncbi:hypothetical protein DMP14_25890 [Pseudonocardia sp. Ae707_Ps2]
MGVERWSVACEAPHVPRHVVEVQVSEWEYGCCLPPPRLGDLSEWWLDLCPGYDPACELLWTVTHDTPARGGQIWLDGGDGLHARWLSEYEPPPAPGIRLLHGALFATAHGGRRPEDPGAVRGRIERIRVMSHEMRRAPWHGTNAFERVPGSVELRDVAEGPDRFAWTTGPGRTETGLLLDLALDQRA